MTEDLRDNAGEPVTVAIELADRVSAFTVSLAGSRRASRADFVDAPAAAELIFFHTEVDPESGGRGLAGLLLGEALADSIRNGLTVVAVCPLFARPLEKRGDEFVAAGGTFRALTRADLALVTRVAGRGA